MGVIRVGLLGLGTVGSGVFKTIQQQQQNLLNRVGHKVEVVKVLVRDKQKKRSLSIDEELLTTSFEEVLEADLDVLIEVMGGVEPTFDYIYEAFQKGCHVVTANKELLAKRGKELIKIAHHFQRHFYYEASVAGGIPILGVIRQLLQTNDVEEISGILNGTTNYILTQMEENNAKYEDVLKEAQELGYAEADPTSDVDGYDAMYKLYILSQLVYGRAPELPSIRREGISGIGLTEIQVAKQLGYRFKLLASAKQEGEHLALSVQPTLVSLEHPLAQVNDVNNAVFLKGNIVGELLLSGKGAGEFPTASAVVEDLSFLLTQIYTPQKEWKVDQGVSPEGVFHKSTEERTSSEHFFIYIETKEKDLSKLYVLLEELDQHQLTLHQVQTMETEEKKLAIGLIVQGAPQPFTQYLIDAFSVYVTCHQVIGDQEHPLPIQSVSKELNIAEHQAVNL